MDVRNCRFFLRKIDPLSRPWNLLKVLEVDPGPPCSAQALVLVQDQDCPVWVEKQWLTDDELSHYYKSTSTSLPVRKTIQLRSQTLAPRTPTTTTPTPTPLTLTTTTNNTTTTTTPTPTTTTTSTTTTTTTTTTT